MAVTVDLWWAPEIRHYFKGIFGNYRNWQRYEALVGQRMILESFAGCTRGWQL